MRKLNEGEVLISDAAKRGAKLRIHRPGFKEKIFALAWQNRVDGRTVFKVTGWRSAVLIRVYSKERITFTMWWDYLCDSELRKTISIKSVAYLIREYAADKVKAVRGGITKYLEGIHRNRCWNCKVQWSDEVIRENYGYCPVCQCVKVEGYKELHK